MNYFMIKLAPLAGLTAALLACGPTRETVPAPRMGAAVTVAAPRIMVGPNVRISTDRSEEAHYETHAAAHPTDPNRILATAIIYPKVGRRSVIVYGTRDGGRTWTTEFNDPILVDTGDPAVGFGPDGTEFFTSLPAKGHPLETRPAKPTHNWDGRTTLVWRRPQGTSKWLDPAIFMFADRQYLAFDDTKGKYHGNIYLSGDPRPNSGFAIFTSRDGGKTFGKQVESDHRGASVGNAVVASDGTIIGTYASDDGHVRVVTSVDGGATLRPSVVVDTFVRAGGRKDANANNVNHFLTIAIDRSGGRFNDRVYVTWPDRRTGRALNYFAYSTDKGATWSKSFVVGDNPPSDTTARFMPTVAVNKDGVVGLLWYDRRENPDNRSYHARFSASLDGGVTWLPSVRLSETTFSSGAVAQKSAFPRNGGDTAGLATSADGVFHPVWVTDFNDIPQVWTARVSVR
jgi:hypothetical protein